MECEKLLVGVTGSFSGDLCGVNRALHKKYVNKKMRSTELRMKNAQLLIVATQINSFQPVCENRACIFTEIKIHTDKNYINCVANKVYHKKKDFARVNKK